MPKEINRLVSWNGKKCQSKIFNLTIWQTKTRFNVFNITWNFFRHERERKQGSRKDLKVPSCELIIKLNLFCINKFNLRGATLERLNLAEVITNVGITCCRGISRYQTKDRKEASQTLGTFKAFQLFPLTFVVLVSLSLCSRLDKPNLYNEANDSGAVQKRFELKTLAFLIRFSNLKQDK